MAALTTAPSLGLSQKKCSINGDLDTSTTPEALKVLNSVARDIIELGELYSDPLADGPVIQASATRSLARGTNFDAIKSMLKEVI
ncbi:hypothetical protein K2173_017905 [Erythroxylum novogranatense]|uniref:tryptophan synthase n=1 Tax=Erythroxylum novogranatense TaxID=1862640 RepID=A0AAV8S6K8_9ROSI|nr:hypothetical protein K2173_017905 [Erythroxylum novogranatense]